MRRVPLLGIPLLVFACSTLVPTELLVHIDADSISRARARQLHVRIVSQEGTTRLDRVASLFGDPPEIKLPTKVPVVPKDDDSERTFTVFAELTDQGSVAFNKKAATLSFAKNSLVDVDLYFSDLCIDIACPAGQTCADGACVDLATPPHGPNGPFATDAQVAYCEGPLCWEEPRPGGQGVSAACLSAPGAGFAVSVGWALKLADGLWVPELLPPGGPVASMGCWGDGDVVATRGTGILERSASGWTSLDLGGAALHGLWGLDSSDVWAVADGGGIWRRKNHGSWAKVDSGITTDLAGIFGLSATDIYVVGAQSTLLHYDGNAFTAVPGPAAADPSFTHVTATSKDDLAVKAGSSVWSFDGKAWSEYAPYLGVVSLIGGPSGLFIAGGSRGSTHFRTKPGVPWALGAVPYPFDGPALGALALSGQSAIVGGDGGSLAHWSGTAWDSQAAWDSRAYYSGIASDPDHPAHAIVVGASEVLERVSEGVWRRRVVGQGPEVKTPNLRAVWMGHGLSVAVGLAGAIIESPDGHDWTAVPSGSTLDLAAVDAAGAQILAAGASGALLARGASGWAPFATPIPGGPSVTALRGSADGSWVAGAADGSVWKFAAGSSWTKLGVLASAVTDLALDSKGEVWACAGSIQHLVGGAFTPFAVTTSGPPLKLLLDGVVPGWIATEQGIYQLQPGGGYNGVGPGASAITRAANGRFFMVGAPGRILAQPAP